MTDTQAPHHPLTCEACQILDRSDGVEDGKIFTPAHIPVKNESKLVEGLLKTQDRVADHVTNFAGSLRFVYLHGVWFGIWILINVGLIGAGAEFDKFPFGLLTMIVSLEAIFLSTFVMVSQNRQAARSDIRSQVDFENNLRAEIWAVHVGAKLGVDPAHVEEVVAEALIALKEAGA
jgi:uncharacterized membrane protein